MAKEIRFTFYSIKKNIQSNAELRTSFLMNIFGMAINNTAFIILWVFFVQSVGVIGGWTAADIVGLQGFTALSYGLVFSMAMGIRKLPDYVASGSFDRYMISPKNLLLRVATSAFNASAVGDTLFGLTCLIIYGFLIHAGLLQILIMAVLVILAMIVFLGVVIMISSVSFFFMDPVPMTSGLFEMFLTPALFHGGAFQGAMRVIFTFFIPSLLIGALPVEAVKNLSLDKFALIAVIAAIWLTVSILIFNKAIRKYESSNFMTFGN
jgi:ABC-2 type transport system permease protein